MAAAPYRLGIDLGTTYSAAVICRGRAGGAGWGEPEIVALGSQSASVASVLYLGADGAVLVGEAAERRGLTEPDRVVRQFKRRIGDDVPLVVGDAVHTAHELAARMGRWIVDKVAEREGGPAEAVAVTHPAAWGAHKKELLAGALRQVGLDGITFLPEPQAAAVAYSARERVESGGAVAVYDLGGGTFDAAIVRRTADGFDLPGRPEGIEQLGGVDFDDRVFDHVRDGIGAALDELDVEDPDVISAVMRLRRECVEAKEALSFDTQATIPVMLPGIRTNVRLTRVEFEASIRSSIDHTVDALLRTVESAGLTAPDLQAVLLVGGSSRIPLVAERISEELGRPVAVDSDPKTSIAMGAALTIAPRPAPAPPAPSAPPPTPAVVAPPAAPVPAAPSPPRSGSMPLPAQAYSAPAPAEASSSSSGMLDLRGYTAPPPAPPARPAPDGPPSGRYVMPPERPSSGPHPPQYAQPGPGWQQPPPSSYPPQRPPQGTGWESDDDESGSSVRTIVVVVLAALLLFGIALGIGAYVKAQRQPTSSSAPAVVTTSFVPPSSDLTRSA